MGALSTPRITGSEHPPALHHNLTAEEIIKRPASQNTQFSTHERRSQLFRIDRLKNSFLKHLIDLNGASVGQIGELGISAESLERLLENRPHRNKLELLSRMVLSQDEYSAIKDKVSVAEAGESVKIA